MQVTIDGKKVKLNNKDVLGVGGEATVFKHSNEAVKIYLSPTPERDQKLRALSTLSGGLPNNVIGPNLLVCDARSKQVIGFTMRLLESDYAEVRKLSTKNYRAMTGYTARDVAALFLNAHHTLSAVHRAGLVVGDFNDLNLMFRGTEMLFIDVDSFQFGVYPCMVGTEAFLDPALYGCDLALKPIFRPENDWYSFCVLLFKSLLLAHPYGGVHPTVNTLIERAQRCISVFDSSVKYPRIAYPPELLSDDLAHIFEGWFAQGKRGLFPEQALHDYMAALRVCPSCKAAYPANRARCPLCSTIIPAPAAPVQLTRCVTLIQTTGELVAWHVCGATIYAVAHEDGKAVYYASRDGQTARRLPLFDAIPTAAYAFLEDKLIISPAPDREELLVVDVSGPQPAGLLKTTTGLYGGAMPVFGASAGALYRMSGGYLMRGQFQNGSLIEQAVLSIAENQTWFAVAPDADRVFGYFRVLNTYQHFLFNGQEQVEIALLPLEPGEFLLETSVKFASKTCLVARHTQLNGADRVRLDEVDDRGKVLQTVLIAGTEAADFTPMGAHTYHTNIILRATDNGIVQERLDTHARKNFTPTEPFVRQGDSLFPYLDGLLVISDRRALHITV